MENIQIFEAELRLMELIWENAPIRSTALVQLAGEKLGWKKSTVFTVVKNSPAEISSKMKTLSLHRWSAGNRSAFRKVRVWSTAFLKARHGYS